MNNRFATTLMLAAAGFGLLLVQLPALADDQAVAQTVQQLEHNWIDGMKAGDAAKVGQVLADDWTGLFYDGSKETKQGLLAEIKSGKSKLDSIEVGPMDVKVLGDVAVVQGSDTEKSSAKGMDTSGKWVWMDVFAKRDGKWVAVRSQAAMVK